MKLLKCRKALIISVFAIFPLTLFADEAMIMSYDQKLIDEGFPSPTVKVKFDSNREALFLVDTGASSNVLASWFAKDLPLKKKSEMTIPDSTGTSIKVSLAQSDFKIVERNFANQNFMITDFPPDFEKNNIAGLLSPKSLGNVVAIDFKNGKLWVGETIKKTPKQLKIPLLDRKKQTSCLAPTASMYSVETLISNNKVKMLIDSGAGTTKVFLNSPAGQMLKTKAKDTDKKTSGISGKKVALQEIRNGIFEIGSYKSTTRLLIQDANAKGCPSEGLLGMDILKNCTVLMLKEDLGILCK